MGIMAWLKDRIVNLPKLFTAPIVDEDQKPIEQNESDKHRVERFVLSSNAWVEHLKDCPMCREQYREDGSPSQHCRTGEVLYKTKEDSLTSL